MTRGIDLIKPGSRVRVIADDMVDDYDDSEFIGREGNVGDDDEGTAVAVTIAGARHVFEPHELEVIESPYDAPAHPVCLHEGCETWVRGTKGADALCATHIGDIHNAPEGTDQAALRSVVDKLAQAIYLLNDAASDMDHAAETGTGILLTQEIARFARHAADTADLALMHANNEAKLAERDAR